MLNKVELRNFGPLSRLDWTSLGKINLVIGGNGTGKTFLLKAAYIGLRTLEEYKRGDEQRSASEIIADKLYWTFQLEKIGDLVTKGADSPLSCSLTIGGDELSFSFGKASSRMMMPGWQVLRIVKQFQPQQQTLSPQSDPEPQPN